MIYLEENNNSENHIIFNSSVSVEGKLDIKMMNIIDCHITNKELKVIAEKLEDINSILNNALKRNKVVQSNV